MRHLIGLCLVLLTTTVFADSAELIDPPAESTITYVNVDAHTRAAIERMLVVDTSCSARSRVKVCIVRNGPARLATVGIRIVSTAGGLYVLAQDTRDGKREGIVSDGRAAGVLIAAWLETPTATAAPGEQPPREDPAMSAPRGWRKLTDVGVGGLFGLPEQVGVRGDVGILAHGGWGFGVTLSWARNAEHLATVSSGGMPEHGQLYTNDSRGTIELSHTFAIDWLRVRPALGVGMAVASIRGEIGSWSTRATGVFPTADVSVALGIVFHPRWSFEFGPQIIWLDQTFDNVMSPAGTYVPLHRGGPIRPGAFMNVRYQL